MRRALIISALLHMAVIAIAYFGLPTLFRPDPVISAPVVVEMVAALPDKTIPEPKKAPLPEMKPPPPVEKTPPPPPPPIPEPPPMPVVEAPPEAEPAPPEPKAVPKPKPKPVVAPKPEPAPKVQVASVAPQPKKKPKPPVDAFQSLLRNIAPPKPAARKTAAAPGRKEPAPDPLQTALQRRAVEEELTRMVRKQIIPCWNIPAGAKDVRDMKIALRIRLNLDGSIIGAPQLIDSPRTDPFYRAVAESARRALQNPQCQPLNLPRQQYEIWKSITFNFDPSEALGP